jgi:DNA-directed RNA polymerase II subunit RPB2
VTQNGKEGIATSFTEVTVGDISQLLHENGYQRRGNEVMYNGFTGKKLEAQVFIGDQTHAEDICHPIIL